MWNYIKSYKFHGVFVKNLTAISLVMIMPLFGMSIAIYYYYNSVWEKEIGTINLNTVYRIRDVMDSINSEVDRYVSSVLTDTYVQLYMIPKTSIFNSFEFGYAYQNINTSINTFVLTREYIDSIYLYSENNNFVASNKAAGLFERFFDTSWYTYYEKMDLENNYLAVVRREGIATNKALLALEAENKPSNQEKSYLSFIRLYAPYNKKEGAVIINIETQKLQQIIDDATNKMTESTFIIDRDGNILFNNYNYTDNENTDNNNNDNNNNTDNDWIGKSVSDFEFLKNINFKESKIQYTIKDIGKERKLLSYISSNYNDMSYVSIMPIELYQKRMEFLNILLAAFIILGFIISLVIALLITIKIYHPIENIISIINSPEDWMRLEANQVKDKVDEFKYISTKILRTFMTSKQLEEELASRLVMLKKAQTIALQSQINPHFLFNTLQAANLFAYNLTKGENRVTLILDQLSKLLRNSLRTKEHLITIAEEIEITRSYIEIQKIRYEDKFNVEWDIDRSIMNYKIPKITLQPIIENAIYHGIKPSNKNCNIIISGRVEDDKMQINIHDNGIGFVQSRLDLIIDTLNQEELKENDNIGLSNVHQRIRLIFGDEYGINIESEENNGTTVSITLPLT